MISIKNEFLTVEILLKGAEVARILNSKNTEHNYLWNKKPEVWNNTSPVLFPVVGKSTNNEARLDGKSYPLGNHGFARHTLFHVEELSESKAVLKISSKDLDEHAFPYQFKFTVTYQLLGDTLFTTFAVYNPSDRKIFFSLGAHPAFTVPFDINHSMEDYYLKFDEREELEELEIDKSAFYTGVVKKVTLEDGIIPLSNDTFKNDAIVYRGFKSKHISIKEKNSDREVVVGINHFPLLGLWNKPGEAFVCIEPWCGKSDDVGFTGDFTEKKDLVELNPHEDFSVTYTAKFSY